MHYKSNGPDDSDEVRLGRMHNLLRLAEKANCRPFFGDDE